MEQYEKEFWTSQIISGTIIIEIDDVIYLSQSPSANHKYYANKIYKDTYEAAQQNGLLVEEELIPYLLHFELWSVKEDERLKKIQEELPQLKIKLYEERAKNSSELIRQTINKSREEINNLYFKKHGYDYLTCHGAATAAKNRYMIGSSLRVNDRAYWKDFIDWKKPDYIIDKIIIEVSKFNLDERQLRELSRSEPWRSYWDTAKFSGRGLFDKPSTDLTDNQRLLIRYSRMYDNISEHPECPSDSVINDDDMLDGWMLLQRKNKESEDNKEDVLSRVSDNVKNAEEVFIKANNMDDIKKIQGINDIAGQVAFSQRMKQIKEEKVVNEIDLKETRLQLQIQANQQFRR